MTFTKHFKYLGSYIVYYLRDDYDVEQQISKASASMGSLQPFWDYHAIDLRSKYLIFSDIPCNLLLWGCESWAFREGLLQKLEVFLHRRIIRKILRIGIMQVKEEQITSTTIRCWFYNISTVRHEIARRQLTFLGKIVRNSDSQLPAQLLTAWCDHKRKRGGVFQNNTKSIAQNIRLIIPAAIKDGLMASWVYFALDNVYWRHLVSLLANDASTCSRATRYTTTIVT